MNSKSKWPEIRSWILVTFGAALMTIGAHFFKFPNNFTFGGVTGLCVTIGAKTRFSPGEANLLINAVLLVIGFIFLGKDFGIKTVYATSLMAIALAALDKICPMSHPLTDLPFLELIYSILLPGIGSAILFNVDASSGGTDIIAMIIKKHSSINIGYALLIADFFITLSSLFVFNIQIFLLSLIGMFSKSLVIDNFIHGLNLNKVYNVVCSDPDLIVSFIRDDLNRSATIVDAKGAYSKQKRYMVISVMKPKQGYELRKFIHRQCPGTFIMVTNTYETFGKGFFPEN
ncbi:MAG: YitT family protein [Treponema sp.]|jgi:uncharacterized membrane-anchored protein YitT (DUF2179 family)|nr:YitT family protein [Treponema sp.]